MKMKKVISVVLACACVFSFAACGSKSDSSKSDSAKSDKKEKLVMATNAEFPPFEYYDGDEVVGIDAEFAAAIADKLGMDLKIEDMAFDSIIPAVQSGKADIGAAGMTVTEDRATQVDFSDSYYTGLPYCFSSTGIIFNICIMSGITIINHTIGSATITPAYPSHGTSVAAIIIFPTISRELDTSGIICSPSPCIAFLSMHINAVTK